MNTKMIAYPRPDGTQAPGYVEMPIAGKSAPAVVVIGEGWGLNAQIRSFADRLANGGYRALVPDLFRGKVAQTEDEAKRMASTLDWASAVLDIRGAVQHLKSFAPSKVAVMGFGMGGALAIIAGTQIKEASAGVCFYGITPTEAADPSQVRLPMQFHFAMQDPSCSAPAIEKLEVALRRGNVSYELHRYDAEHGFMNDTRPEVYAPSTSKLAWERTLKFLATYLGG
jgi:carboxymethylenebutenolidase